VRAFQQQRGVVVYHLRGASVIDLVQGKKAVRLSSKTLEPTEEHYTCGSQENARQYEVQCRWLFAENTRDSCGELARLDYPLFFTSGQRWLVLDGNAATLPNELPPVDFLLLRDNFRGDQAAEVLLERLPRPFPTVILDGSNARWYATRLRRAWPADLSPLHITHFDGAFVFPAHFR